MARCEIVRSAYCYHVYTWTNGFKVTQPPQRNSVDDILAQAKWLERRGRLEEGQELLDEFYSRQAQGLNGTKTIH